MKRVSILALTVAALLLLAACSAGQEATPEAIEPAAADVQESAMGEADGADEMASEEMASEEMASEEMASEEMASEEMASEEMASEEMDTADESQADHPDEAMDGEMADDSEEMADGSEEMTMASDLPAWQTLPLTNARTGETFTLADFAGKTVFVEPMATWCTNCRRQLGNVKEAHAQLADEDVIFVALSVETNIGDGTLANYANEAGFDWLFAVLTPELLQELAGDFGRTIANPPATPHFVIRPDGTATDLVTGIEPASDIIAQIQAAQG